MQVCHCISCRKTGGAYCVNLAADKEGLKVEGREHVKSYRLVVSCILHMMYIETCRRRFRAGARTAS